MRAFGRLASRYSQQASPGLVALLACSDSRHVVRTEAPADLAAENERLRQELLAAENEHLKRELAKLQAEKQEQVPAPAASPSAPSRPLRLPTRKKAEGRGNRVYCWGQRAAFPVAVSTGDKDPDADVRVPVEVNWFRLHAERHDCVWHQVAFGPSFGAARCSTGEIFLWGSFRIKGGRQFLEPVALQSGTVPHSRFTDIQCSESAVWGLTSQGHVLVWERVPEMIQDAAARQDRVSGLRPARILEGLERPVRSMSIGPTHASFVLEDGDMYCLGANRHGECAADPYLTPVAGSCRRVHLAAGAEPIVKASCGRSHTAALSSNGLAYSWGDDSKIQLGLGDTRSNFGDERPFSGSAGYQRMLKTGEGMAPTAVQRGGPDGGGMAKAAGMAAKSYGEFAPHHQWTPTQIMPIPLEFERQPFGTPYPPPDDIICGDFITCMTTRDSPDWYSPEEETNRTFCCGENGKGQCGRSMQQAQQIFAAAMTPKCSYTQSVVCGSGHCLAMLKRVGVGSQKMELWGWGMNDRGQAAGNQKGWVCPAARVRLPDQGIRIEAMGIGFSNSAVICSDKMRNGAPLSKQDSVKERSE